MILKKENPIEERGEYGSMRIEKKGGEVLELRSFNRKTGVLKKIDFAAEREKFLSPERTIKS